jgi:hypothetical protein
MKTIELTNDFHNTSAKLRPVLITEGRYAGYHRVSRATRNRLHNELCGSEECICGGTFGERGGAYLRIINEDYDRSYIVDLSGSNV